MTSYFDSIDANCLKIVFTYFNVEEKLLFLTLSKSIKHSFSSAITAAFKNDGLILNNARINLIVNPILPSLPSPSFFSSLSSCCRFDSTKHSTDAVKNFRPSLLTTGSLFTNIEIVLTGESDKRDDFDASFLLVTKTSPQALKYFPSIKTFKLQLIGNVALLHDLNPILQSPSLVNIEKFYFEYSSLSSDDCVNNFHLFKFPHLRLLQIKSTNLYAANIRIPFDLFLLHHPLITDLNLSAVIMDKYRWTQLFSNPSALSNLTHFIFSSDSNNRYNSIIEQLATTIIESTKQPRPLQFLSLVDFSHIGVIDFFLLFRPLSHCPTLTNLEISTGGAVLPFSSDSALPPSLMKSLTKFCFHLSNYYLSQAAMDAQLPGLAEEQLILFLNALSEANLVSLQLDLPPEVKFESESVKLLSQLNKLEELHLINCVYLSKQKNSNLIDWTDTSMFTSWHFSSLTSVILHGFALRQTSFTVIAAGSPNITRFIHHGVVNCDAATFCLLISHYWPSIKLIQSLNVDYNPVHDRLRCLHTWQSLTLDEFETLAHKYPPHPRAFYHLEEFEIPVCQCTTPEIWFKLLQLFHKADSIRCINNIYLSSPQLSHADNQKFMIGVMGMLYLSSLQSISDECVISPDICNSLARSHQSIPNLSNDTEIPKVVRSDYHHLQRRYLKMSTKPPKDTQRQFITRAVDNKMSAREAFFRDVFGSMTADNRAIVTNLLGESMRKFYMDYEKC